MQQLCSGMKPCTLLLERFESITIRWQSLSGAPSHDQCTIPPDQGRVLLNLRSLRNNLPPFPMEVAFPGDTIAVLPDNGVVKVDRSIVRLGQELRCIQPGIRIEGDGKYRIQTNSKRYNLVVEQERVLGVVTGSFSEEYKVDIKAPCQALLPTLAFEGATKRNRPMLKVGDVVFCRVTSASPYVDPELSCMNGKGLADGLGHMQGGYMLETTTGHCRKLLQQPPPLELQLICDAVACELAVGVNGRVWVKSKEPKKTAALVRVLQTCAGTVDASQIQSTIAEELSVFSSSIDVKKE